MQNFRRKIKPWMLPISMVIGVLLHSYIGYVAFLSPYLIFIMLLITYCKVSFSHFRVDGSMWWLLAIQVIGASGVFLLLRQFNVAVAESIFICIFCPTATAAPVITGMLGGKVERVATFSLLSNLVVAFTAPVILALLGGGNNPDFMASFTRIATNVLPLILGPLVVALMLKMTFPKVRDEIAHHQGLSFYIWAVALIIVVGNSVSFLMKEPASRIPEMAVIAVLSLLACLAQFYLGRKIGARYGDRVAGAQSLGQKNTVLAIWLALTYLDPIASVGPACYIAWHNTVNSIQIYKRAHAGML
jgi:BASS family bile acid:Na+ symporter